MSLTTAYALSIVGLIGLTIGADWLVDGASRIAVRFGVSSLVIGLTVVAYGTSAPEMMASVVAAIQNRAEVTVGNVVGSNIANIGLILGLTALLTPFTVGRGVLRRQVPFMLGVTVLFYLGARRLVFDRWTGAVLIALLVVFNLLSFYWARADGLLDKRNGGNGGNGDRQSEGESHSLSGAILRTGAGLVLLLGGAHFLVTGAVTVAQHYGLSDFIIGVTLVAVGTSLPELATSIAAGMKGQTDLIVGNLVGSNLFNILGALGLSALIQPVAVDPNLLSFEFVVLLVFTAAMAITLASNQRLLRLEGIVLLAGYVGFIGWLFT